MSRQLLATFIIKNDLIRILREIILTYELSSDIVYVFNDVQNRNEMICTYNIASISFNRNVLPNTISVHRKKETNTLYTINALNSLIAEINNGVLDKSFAVDWATYRDTLMITTEGQLKKIGLKLKEVISLNKRELN